jgi:2-oxoisovalerate dehydrogenase E1 component
MMQENFLKQAIYIREIETFFLEMFSKGLLNGTVHTCVGQELTPVIVSDKLTDGDKIFSNHRGHGHYIADKNSPDELILELMGKAEGVSCGIGGSQHISTNSFISNGIQGGLAPISVGYSFVQRLNKTKNISVCYIGDGTLGEGQFYEALSLAGIFQTPSLFVIENNGYAQSTSNKHTLKGNVEKRIEGFGLDYFASNIWDIDDLNNKAIKAIENTRSGKPSVLEIECYRLNSHSKGDDNRKESEIAEFKEKDLVNIFIKDNLEWYQEHSADLKKEFNNVVENAQTNPLDLSFLKNNSLIESDIDWVKYNFPKHQEGKRINESINDSLASIIEEFDAILIGEDIIDSTLETPVQYGGAFKVTKGLSEQFPDLVHNTSISEAGIIGFGIGSALCNRPCFVEIMFGDFMTLCVDQIIQQASKIPSMYGKKVNLPLVIRTPMGGRRGYGPTHSQNLEKLFLFWPNIDVVAINCLTDTNKIYRSAVTNNKTTIIIEDKVSYTQETMRKPPIGYKILESDEEFTSFKLEPEFSEPNAVVILYGSMLKELIDVLPDLIDEEIFPTIICPTRLSPLDINIFRNINFDQMPCIFIEEGSKRTSWSSEVISSLLESGKSFNHISRISNEHLIPCAKDLEDIIFPSKLNLVKLITKSMYDR